MWLIITIIVVMIFCIIMYLTRYPKCNKGGRCNADISKTSTRYYSESYRGCLGGDTTFYCSKCGNNITDYLKI